MAGEFCVIGLGRFGWSVAINLARQGQPVLGVDTSEALVQAIGAEIDAAICCDSTDEASLAELQLERATCCIVAIGAEGKEASILTTALLRQRGVPRIIARATSDLHARVLVAVGAHDVVNPEKEMGERMARALARPSIKEQIPLGEGATLAEVQLPEAFAGKTLIDLEVRRRFDVSVVAVRREGRIHSNLLALGPFRSGDVLFLIGSEEAVAKLAALS